MAALDGLPPCTRCSLSPTSRSKGFPAALLTRLRAVLCSQHHRRRQATQPSSSIQRQRISQANPTRKANGSFHGYVTDSPVPPVLAAGTECTDLLCTRACSMGRATACGEPQATELSVYYRHNSRHDSDHGFTQADYMFKILKSCSAL